MPRRGQYAPGRRSRDGPRPRPGTCRDRAGGPTCRRYRQVDGMSGFRPWRSSRWAPPHNTSVACVAHEMRQATTRRTDPVCVSGSAGRVGRRSHQPTAPRLGEQAADVAQEVLAARDHPPPRRDDVGDVGGRGGEDHPLDRVGVGAARGADRVQPDGDQVGDARRCRSRRRPAEPSDACPARVAASSRAAADQCPRCCEASRSSSSTARASSSRSTTAWLSEPRVSGRAGVAHPAGRADAVGQVALGRRAHADRTCRRCPSSPMSSSVRWVACTAVVRGPSRPRSCSSRVGVTPYAARQASFSAALLGDVHVQRRLVRRPRRRPCELVGRHRPHRVRRGADHARRRPGYAVAQRSARVRPAVGVAVAEALLHARRAAAPMPPVR